MAFLDNLLGASPTPDVSVIAFAAEPSLFAAAGATESQLREAIRSIEPTDQPGDLSAAVALAADVSGATAMALAPATESGEPPEPSLAALFTDGIASGDAVVAGLRIIERRPSLVEQARPNLGLVALSAARDFDDPTTVRVFARVTNTGPNRVTLPLSFLRSGEVVHRETLDIPPANAAAPGEAGATHTIRIPGTGAITARIDRADALASDNEATIVIDAPAAPRVLLAAPADASGGNNPAPDPFLTDILRELDTRAVRVITGARLATAPAADLAAFDLIILDRVTPTLTPPVPTLSFGAAFAGLATDEEPEPIRPPTAPVAWDRDHPLLRYAPLDTLLVGRRLDLTPAESAGWRTLASGPDSPLIIASPDRPARVVVGFPLRDSNWPLQVSLPIFMAEALTSLAERDTLGTHTRTTEPAILSLSAPPERLSIQGPIEREITVPESVRTRGLTRVEVSLGVLERVGVYSVDTPRNGRRIVAAHLLDEKTSALRPTRQPFPSEARARSGGAEAGEDLGRAPRELWPWLVMIAAALLCVEWVIFAARMRV